MLTIISSLALAFSVSRGDVVTHWTFDIVKNGASAELATGLDVDVVGATLQQGALHGCLYFDGVDDVASVQDIGSAQASVGSFAEGTISCWFRFDHSPLFMDIETIFYLGAENSYSSYGTSANCYELEIGHFSSQRRLYWTNILTQDVDTDIPLCWSTTDHLDTSRWYHIVSTTSEKGTRIFLDDVEIFDPGACTWQFGNETTRRFLGDVIEQEVLWFGKGLWNGEHQFYEGAIDEFKIWNRAITPEEVHAEYERVASVGAFEIDPAIPNEFVYAGEDVELHGTLDNIVKIQWQVGDGVWNTLMNTSLEPTWNLLFSETIPVGRNEIKVLGRNAANRSYSDSRIVIQPDMNGDGSVNIHDLLEVISSWGECECVQDLSGNGRVDVADVLLLISVWG